MLNTKFTPFCIVLVSFFIKSCSHTIKLQSGDFLFQDLDCGTLCDGIEDATIGKKGERISHMGIVYIENDSIYVIEAYDGVSKTPLDTFLKRSTDSNLQPKVWLGRLKKPYQKHIPVSLINAQKRIGLPYDDAFKMNNGKYYCSELVYDTFLDNNGKPLFKIKPMTFVNQKTHKLDSVWVSYFKQLKIPIPEGEPGCNPIDYFESEKVTILNFQF